MCLFLVYFLIFIYWYSTVSYFIFFFFFWYRICCLCAPTLYKKLKEIKPEGCKVVLFEYDQRFSTFGKDFVFYDYNDPLNIPDSQGKSSFDVVFADPPFLSEECLSKISKTVKYLMKDKIIICTGKLEFKM